MNRSSGWWFVSFGPLIQSEDYTAHGKQLYGNEVDTLLGASDILQPTIGWALAPWQPSVNQYDLRLSDHLKPDKGLQQHLVRWDAANMVLVLKCVPLFLEQGLFFHEELTGRGTRSKPTTGEPNRPQISVSYQPKRCCCWQLKLQLFPSHEWHCDIHRRVNSVGSMRISFSVSKLILVISWSTRKLSSNMFTLVNAKESERTFQVDNLVVCN